MDGERMDSLEGWVAVRPNLFQEPEQHKMGFIVAWNQVDSKFAVTCHNRTAQRRKRREGEDGEQSSWAGLYSAHDLEHIHRQLSSVCSRLQPCFPGLPAPLPAGSLWTLLFPNAPCWERSPGEEEALCRALERYLGAAMEECGRHIVLDLLFPEDGDDADKYFENLHEFRKKSLEEQVCRAKEAVRTVRLLRGDPTVTARVTHRAAFSAAELRSVCDPVTHILGGFVPGVGASLGYVNAFWSAGSG